MSLLSLDYFLLVIITSCTNHDFIVVSLKGTKLPVFLSQKCRRPIGQRKLQLLLVKAKHFLILTLNLVLIFVSQ